MSLVKNLPNGKKASLAKAAPLTSSPAFLTAILKLSTRFGCPLPIPNIQLFCHKRVKVSTRRVKMGRLVIVKTGHLVQVGLTKEHIVGFLIHFL